MRASARRTAAALQIRSFDTATRTFTGYASTFGGDPDSYGDVVTRGAFARTLRERAGKIVMLWQHDTTQPIGVWEELREDARGLFVRGRLVETACANDAYALLKAGAITGLSIGFRTVQSRPDPDGLTRLLTDVDLFEISLVTMPANDGARILDVRADGRSTTSLLVALDRLAANVRASNLRFDAQVDDLSTRLASVPPRRPEPRAPQPLSAAEKHARIALYRHYSRSPIHPFIGVSC